MTTFLRAVGDDIEVTPVGEVDEVDMYLEQSGDDVVFRSTPLDMDIPAAEDVVPPATVYDPATGENVVGTAEGGGTVNRYSGELDVAVEMDGGEIDVAVEVE